MYIQIFVKKIFWLTNNKKTVKYFKGVIISGLDFQTEIGPDPLKNRIRILIRALKPDPALD